MLYLAAGTFALTAAYWTAISRVLGIVFIAAFAAIAIDRGVRALQRLGLSRRVATVVALGSLGGVVLAFLLVALPEAATQLAALGRAAPSMGREMANSDAWEAIFGRAEVSDGVVAAAQRFLTSAPSLVGGFFSTLVGTIFQFGMAVLAAVFLLISGRQVLTLLVRAVPTLAQERPWDVIGEIHDSIGRYVVGATIQATIAGITVALMLYVVSVPYAIALGLVTFFWDFIPMIGSTIAAIPCVIVALATQGVGTAVFVGVFITVFTQIENSIIQPSIQGSKAKLPGAAIFFSVLIGGALFGIVGAIFAVPATSVIATVLRHWFEHRGTDKLVAPPLFDEHGRVIRRREASADA